MTRCLGRSDLLRLFDAHACLDRLWHGFTASPARIGAQRVRTDLPGPASASVLFPGLLPGIPAYTVRDETGHRGSGAVSRGVVCLHDLDTGEPLALLDAGALADWRTGLSAALGAHALARSDADVLGVLGCGARAEVLTRGLAALRPLAGVVVADRDGERAVDFARRCQEALGIQARSVATAEEVGAKAEVIAVAADTSVSLLGRVGERPGVHYALLGVGAVDGGEILTGLPRGARAIVDDTELADGFGGDAPRVAGTLRDVLTGTVAARTSADAVTAYVPFGPPWQDLTLSWLAYRSAVEAGVGTDLDFLA
ncbi:ornithine cyclodeaminase family protein [Marinactinospora thermotolerans]|uniref:hypothetical protein n=1 Tax=Marinactinospora thermotolerans TaxID=531310 RepID=UPI00099ADA91|nr:hypothetical protein [Marinactinospora thermotolerans]